MGFAPVIDRFDRKLGKPGGGQLLADLADVVMAVRRAGHEQGWILRKERGQCLGHDVGEFVVGDPVPDVEEETTLRLQDAAGLPVAFHPVGKEHDAELAGDDIECPILERQGERIGLSPRHAIRWACRAAA